MAVLVTCVLALALLMLLLAVSMSLFRVSGNRPTGEPVDPKAPPFGTTWFAKFHLSQQNTAEYAPILAILMLFIHFQSNLVGKPVAWSTAAAAVLVTLGRYGFVATVLMSPNCKKFFFPKAVVVTGMYVSFAWLLLEASRYR